MRKSILFFSLLLIIGCKETAQINPVGNGLFNKYYGNGVLRDAIPDIPEGRTLNLTSDNNIIGVTTVAVRNIGDTVISQAYIFKVDANGFLTNEILIGNSYITRAVDMAADANGNHYLLLNNIKGVQAGIPEMQIVKISDGLDTAWTKNYFLQTDNQGRAISIDDSGNIIILGNYFPDGYNTDGSGRSKMFTAKFSADGETMWVDSLGVNNESNPVGKTINVYTDGNQRYAWCAEDMNKIIRKPKLIITDENGNIWQNNGINADPDSTESGSELLRTDNGTFLIAGTIHLANSTQMRVVRLSNNGELLWTRNFGGAGNETGISVCEADDNGFLILGTTDSFGNGGTDLYLVKTDNAGGFLWEKTYGGPDNETASKIIKVNGGYAIIGTTEVAGTRLILIIRTDLEGNSQ